MILVTVPRPLGRKTGGEETYEDPELEEQEHDAQIPQHISTAMRQRLGKTEVGSVGRKWASDQINIYQQSSGGFPLHLWLFLLLI